MDAVTKMETKHKADLQREMDAVTTMETKQKADLQREMDAVTALTNLNAAKVAVQKQKATELVKEAAVSRKAAAATKQSFGVEISGLKVEAKRALRGQRKELTADIMTKKSTIANISSQLKEATSHTDSLKRLAKELDIAQELGSKRQKKVVVAKSQFDTLRDQLDAMKLSLDTTYGELTEKKQELVSLKILNERLEHECCEATEEIVVSTSCFDVSISITLLTTTIIC